MVFTNSLSSYYEKFIATGEVKCIDEEIPFEIPPSWEWARFSTIVNMSPAVSAEGDVDAAFMPMALINAGYGSEYSYETKKWSLIKTGFTKMVVGDIAFAKITPCFQNRKSFILGNVPGKVAAATTELNVLRLYGQTLYAWYVLYFIKSDYFIKEAKYKGTAGQQRVLSSYIQNKLFPIPPYNEQYRIIEKIQEVLPVVDKYEKSQKGLDKLNALIFDKLRKSILQEAIQGKLVSQIIEEGTADKLLVEIREEKEHLVKDGKLKKSALTDSIIYKGDDNKYYEQVNEKCLDITEQIPFEIPENWVWVRMGQIGDWGAGSTPQRGNANYYNGKILWLKTGELNNGIVYDTEEKVTQKAFQDCSLRMNKIGDVLIAMYGATIGKLAIVGKELTTNQACCGCTPYLIYNWYLFYFLMASRDSFIKKGEGGAQPNISRVKLIEYLIPLPPLKEQYRIVAQIEKLFEQLR